MLDVLLVTILHGNSATQSGLETVIIYVAAAVLGAVILGIGRATMNLIRSRQARKRSEETDNKTLTDFFFGTERDPRTRTPAREGWTTKVDRQLEQLRKTQHQTSNAVQQILYELQPNGGSNFRGAVERVTDIATEKTNGDDKPVDPS